MKPIIELRNAKKIYEMGDVQVKALDGVDLSIGSNEFISIVGKSGSGKSTLLNVMCCLSRPTTGEVLVDGKNISKLNDNQLAKIRGEKIGFVFQTFNLVARLDSLENVILPTTFLRKPEKESKKRALKILENVGLAERAKHKPSEMSGGERQRVAIARALVNDPPIIVADEPTGNLDSKTGKAIMDLLEKLHKGGKTVIIVTHDKSLAKRAKRQIYMKDGKIESMKVMK